MRKKEKKKKELAEAGQYRTGSSMFCHMLIIMLPVIGLIYGAITYRRADDKELKSICASMLFVRLAGIIIYFLYFTFLLKVAMKVAAMY